LTDVAASQIEKMSQTDRPKRILIAEDDPSIMHLLSAQLEMEGYEIVQAIDGAAAWQALQQEELPDLVLLDILMPNMSGYEVCRRIRATPRLAALPVLILTALQDSASRLKGLEAGANDFLGKPWSKAELQTRIRTLIRLKEVQDSLQKQHERLEHLYDISRELSTNLDLNQMLSSLLIRAARAVGAQGGSIVLLSRRKPWRMIRLDQGGEPEVVSPAALNSIEGEIVSWLFEARRALAVRDTTMTANPEGWGATRSVGAVPLVLKGRLRGTMLFHHQEPGWFEDEHLELLTTIARQAAISIENAWLFGRVQEERQRFATLIASMDEAVIATDREGRISLVNPAGVSLLGHPDHDVVGKSLGEIVSDDALLALFNQVAAENRSLAVELGWDKNTLYATVSPLGESGQVAVIQDITPLKALQAMRLAAEQEKAARVRATFEQYMSPALVDRALSEERGPMEARERRHVALLFADLRGFTRLTMRFPPDDVVAILNQFFTVMTDIAYSYNGTIFDIAGDELMVGFGAPFEMQDPIAAAVNAAIEMQTVFTGLSEEWYTAHGGERVGMGIGIDYGEVVVGNVGSPTRMNYSLVGVIVNNAHALVATAGDGEIRFSRAVMERFRTRDLTHPITPVAGVQLKGRDEPETVYRIVVDRQVNG
jgi:PAS domain S-box-containing protein